MVLFRSVFGSIYWTNTEKLVTMVLLTMVMVRVVAVALLIMVILFLSESLIDGDIDAVVRTLKMNDGYAFWKNGTAKHYFNYSQAPSNSSNPIPLGQWVNMAIVNDGSAVKYYMNGVQFTPPSNWQASTGNLKKCIFMVLLALPIPIMTNSVFPKVRFIGKTILLDSLRLISQWH